MIIGAFLCAGTIWRSSLGINFSNLSPFVACWITYFAAVAFVTTGRHKILLSVSSLFLIIGCVEIGVLAHEKFVKPAGKTYSYDTDAPLGWIAEHDSVGYAFKGPVELLASASVEGEVVYENVHYQIDDFGRRTCSNTMDASHHALFFGGSFAFGEGLANNQTLGCQFQQKSNGRYQSLTYAMMGWGASQTLIQLGSDSLFADIQQTSGVAVFSFIEDHIYRTTWKIDGASDFPFFPFFSLADDGGLVGPFKASDRRALGLARDFYSFLREFSPSFRNMVDPDWFRIGSDAQAAMTTARVLGAARQRYQSRFSGEFIVLLWPRDGLDPWLEELFVDELTQQDVVVIKVPPLPGDPSEAQIHPFDGHPSRKETAWVAQYLADTLQSTEN
jgi:hypothetical protein